MKKNNISQIIGFKSVEEAMNPVIEKKPFGNFFAGNDKMPPSMQALIELVENAHIGAEHANTPKIDISIEDYQGNSYLLIKNNGAPIEEKYYDALVDFGVMSHEKTRFSRFNTGSKTADAKFTNGTGTSRIYMKYEEGWRYIDRTNWPSKPKKSKLISFDEEKWPFEDEFVTVVFLEVADKSILNDITENNITMAFFPDIFFGRFDIYFNVKNLIGKAFTNNLIKSANVSSEDAVNNSLIPETVKGAVQVSHISIRIDKENTNSDFPLLARNENYQGVFIYTEGCFTEWVGASRISSRYTTSGRLSKTHDSWNGMIDIIDVKVLDPTRYKHYYTNNNKSSIQWTRHDSRILTLIIDNICGDDYRAGYENTLEMAHKAIIERIISEDIKANKNLRHLEEVWITQSYKEQTVNSNETVTYVPGRVDSLTLTLTKANRAKYVAFCKKKKHDPSSPYGPKGYVLDERDFAEAFYSGNVFPDTPAIKIYEHKKIKNVISTNHITQLIGYYDQIRLHYCKKADERLNISLHAVGNDLGDTDKNYIEMKKKDGYNIHAMFVPELDALLKK